MRDLTLSFRSARGAELARAVGGASPATACSPIEFTIGGRRQTPLVDGTFGRNTFAERVQRLPGVRFPVR